MAKRSSNLPKHGSKDWTSVSECCGLLTTSCICLLGEGATLWCYTKADASDERVGKHCPCVRECMLCLSMNVKMSLLSWYIIKNKMLCHFRHWKCIKIKAWGSVFFVSFLNGRAKYKAIKYLLLGAENYSRVCLSSLWNEWKSMAS